MVIENDTVRGYDTYDSCIVAAETEQEARLILPGGYQFDNRQRTWCQSADEVTVEYLGTTDRKISGVILASFNAG